MTLQLHFQAIGDTLILYDLMKRMTFYLKKHEKNYLAK